MIIRKIIRQGNNAFTITLPIQWIQENDLDAGENVEIEIENQQLIISTQKKAQKLITNSDVSKLKRPQIFQTILSLYLKGADRIEIVHNDSKTILDIEKELTGMILEEHSNNKSVFESVALVEESNKEYMSKILIHLKSLTQNFKKYSFEELVIQEKLLDKIILFQIRNLHKYSNIKKEYNTLLLCYIIDTIADLLIEIKEHMKKENEYNIQLIEKYITNYVDLLMKNNIEELVLELRSFRNAINHKTFVDGLMYALAEVMYNFVGFLEK